jgi:hypothetical protein
MDNSGILVAAWQWFSTIGLTTLVVAWYRQVQWNHRQDLAIAALESRLADYVTLRQDMNLMSTTVTEIRVIVGQLKEQSDYARREADRRRSP